MILISHSPCLYSNTFFPGLNSSYSSRGIYREWCKKYVSLRSQNWLDFTFGFVIGQVNGKGKHITLQQCMNWPVAHPLNSTFCFVLWPTAHPFMTNNWWKTWLPEGHCPEGYLIATRFWMVVICPIFKCLTVLEFSFILFDLCLFITIFNFILNYVPIVTFWIFTYHKIWILLIIFCFLWNYWIIYFLTFLEVFWSVVS